MKKICIAKRLLFMLGISFCLLMGTMFFYETCKKSVETNISTIEGQQDDFSQPITDISSLLDGTINGYIYFGRDTCPICKQFNIALSAEYDNIPNLVIYKFDTDYWRENPDFQRVLEQYAVQNIPCLIKKENSNIQIFGANSEDENLSQSTLHDFLSS